MRTLSFTVTQAQAGHALGSLLQTQLGISDSLLARLKRREQGICLNGQRAYTTARPLAGDLVQVQIGDDPVKRAPPMAFPLSYTRTRISWCSISPAAWLSTPPPAPLGN